MSKLRWGLARALGTFALAGAVAPGRAIAADAATSAQKIDQLVALLNDPEVQATLKAHSAAIPGQTPTDSFSAWLDGTRAHIHAVVEAAVSAPQTLANAASALAHRFGGANLPITLLLVALVVIAAYAAQVYVTRKLSAHRAGNGTTSETADRIITVALSTLSVVFAVIAAYLILPWPEPTSMLVRPWFLAGMAMFLVYSVTDTSWAGQSETSEDTEAGHWFSHGRRFALVFLSGWAVVRTLIELGTGRSFALLVAYLFGVGLIALASHAVWSRPVQADQTSTRRTAINMGLTLIFVALGVLWVADMTVALWLGIYALVLPMILPLITRVVRNASSPRVANSPTQATEGETDGETEEAPADTEGHSPVPTIRTVLIERGARLVVLVLAMGWMIVIANAHAARFMQTEGVSKLLAGVFQGVVVLVIADLLWQLTKVALLRREAEAAKVAEDPAERARNSRMRTLLPILRNALAALIGTIAVLMALSSLGVAIAPLIAGAGVFGVAIGFGSQTLVKDVIAGVFYLLDDAFRVGEYIQTGSYKGTVEGFSLRSVRLRHHRGPVYIVPFGSLGAVQNMSRDWGKDKFLITVPFDTDLEKVRKIAKKVGQTITEDPELGPAIIEPVKMKGVEQVVDHGLVLGFGMMFKPTGQQTMIRRKAYAMLREAFAENGISFAQPVVHVSGGGDDNAAAAHSAVVASARKAAEEAAQAGR